MRRDNLGRTIAEFILASMAVVGLGAALFAMSHELESSQQVAPGLSSRRDFPMEEPGTALSPGDRQRAT